MPSFEKWSGVFITDKPVEFGIGGSFPGNSAPLFPLYLYPDENALDGSETRQPNLNMDIVNEVSRLTGLAFTPEKDGAEDSFSPIDILDYIYAVLYSNNYRAKYKEFLKIDFPRVPYPQNAEEFQKLAAIGSMLRPLHLLKNVSPAMDAADFPIAGTNEVETVKYKEGKIHINKTQYFDSIPLETWEYYIGGYQPAQKWLKDRKGRVLSFEDIEHYQKIIAVLKMTIELQAQIDEEIKV
jgi:predicted helicase